MATTNIQKLINELEATRQQKQAEIANLIEEAKLKLQIAKLKSPVYELQQIDANNTAQLDAILSIIEEHYSEENRKVIGTYGMGVMANKLLTIAQCIMYSKQHNKQELLMITGVSEQFIEDLLESFGSTSYFSPREMRIIPARQPEIQSLRHMLNEFATSIGLIGNINLSKVTTENMEYLYARAEVKANEMLENTQKYAAQAKLTYAE